MIYITVDLEKWIFMEQLEGYEEPDKQEMVCCY